MATDHTEPVSDATVLMLTSEDPARLLGFGVDTLDGGLVAADGLSHLKPDLLQLKQMM